MIGGRPGTYLLLAFLHNEKEATCWVCSLLVNSLGAMTGECMDFEPCAVMGGIRDSIEKSAAFEACNPWPSRFMLISAKHGRC